jgi:hypothetical protein
MTAKGQRALAMVHQNNYSWGERLVSWGDPQQESGARAPDAGMDASPRLPSRSGLVLATSLVSC